MPGETSSAVEQFKLLPLARRLSGPERRIKFQKFPSQQLALVDSGTPYDIDKMCEKVRLNVPCELSGQRGRRGARCRSHGELGDDGVTESRVEGFVVAKGGYCNARMVRWQDTRVIRRQGKGERGRGRGGGEGPRFNRATQKNFELRGGFNHFWGSYWWRTAPLTSRVDRDL